MNFYKKQNRNEYKFSVGGEEIKVRSLMNCLTFLVSACESASVLILFSPYSNKDATVSAKGKQ